jgi:hypothetical protein
MWHLWGLLAVVGIHWFFLFFWVYGFSSIMQSLLFFFEIYRQGHQLFWFFGMDILLISGILALNGYQVFLLVFYAICWFGFVLLIKTNFSWSGLRLLTIMVWIWCTLLRQLLLWTLWYEFLVTSIFGFVLMKSYTIGIEWWYTHYKGRADIFCYMGMDILLSGIELLTSSCQTASWQRGKFMASVWPSGKTKACFTPWSFMESARIRWQGPKKGD